MQVRLSFEQGVEDRGQLDQKRHLCAARILERLAAGTKCFGNKSVKLSHSFIDAAFLGV